MRIVGGNLWQMMFVFNWPRTNDYLVDPSEQWLFNETYRMDQTEAFEKVHRYLSIYSIPDRVKKELELNNLNKQNQLPMWSGNTPYVKQEPKTSRNELCPCGSGKKYKKCCLNK
ncbi:MAG: SEC-C domain-containing protein [Bacteroidetes bacterium]|nr:SEC-C domain-containing protein [Bacteroidota bacterium]